MESRGPLSLQSVSSAAACRRTVLQSSSVRAQRTSAWIWRPWRAASISRTWAWGALPPARLRGPQATAPQRQNWRETRPSQAPQEPRSWGEDVAGRGHGAAQRAGRGQTCPRPGILPARAAPGWRGPGQSQVLVTLPAGTPVPGPGATRDLCCQMKHRHVLLRTHMCTQEHKSSPKHTCTCTHTRMGAQTSTNPGLGGCTEPHVQGLASMHKPTLKTTGAHGRQTQTQRYALGVWKLAHLQICTLTVMHAPALLVV